jgi:hypothetical protein
VGIADVARVAGCWEQQVGPVGSTFPVTLDFDGSGSIDALDMVAVAGEWEWPAF